MKFRNILIVIFIILIYFLYNFQYFHYVSEFSLRKLQIAVENNQVTKYRKLYSEIRIVIPKNSVICYFPMPQNSEKTSNNRIINHFFLVQYGLAPILLYPFEENCDYVISNKSLNQNFQNDKFSLFEEINEENVIYKRIKRD